MADYSDRYESALEAQGFTDPTDETPFEDGNPDGWAHGAVDQTGGFVMVRQWFTCEGVGRVHEECPGREVEYQCGYGSDPGVSLQKFEWRGDQFQDGKGAYEFAGVVESRGVDENTDERKAEVARELMEDFER